MTDDQIIKAFKDGQLVVFPTDTVWGVGCVVENKNSLLRLYQLKQRPINKPTAILTGSLKQAQKLGRFSNIEKKIVKYFWPGGVTVVVPATSLVPTMVLSDRKTIGLRMPKDDWLLGILQKLPLGIVATSANFAGQKTPIKKTDLDKKFLQKVDYIVDKSKNKGHEASTVVEQIKGKLFFSRIGQIKPARIERVAYGNC